jgi:tetratricopeptide (TPR) repeat protein
MGAIYRARDQQDDRLVALKLVNALDAQSIERFEREAKALVDLSHPSIVEYRAHGRMNDTTLYLAMEWLEGEDLASRLGVARLSCSEAVECMKQVAVALAVAHARGVVHRDVKPSNLFLVDLSPSNVKLLDFGVARFLGLDALTGTGTLVGTPLYMSPEQVTGADITPRSDVFALGAVMFHCVTGRPPFLAKNLPELVSKLITADEAPRARAFVPSLPAAVDELIARMLSKDSRKRPADAAEVAAALDAGGIHEAVAFATAETSNVSIPVAVEKSAKPLAQARAAMADGCWEDARVAFLTAISEEDSLEARMGLADALWWIGDGAGMMAQLELVYQRAHVSDEPQSRAMAAMVALRVSLCHKKLFGNASAARGWLARAQRLLGQSPGPLEPFMLLIQGLESSDPTRAVALKRRALELARGADNRDTEIGIMAWLGHSLVSQGDVDEGMALIDEAMAGVAGGEYKQLDTVVGATCAMVTACDELADMDRLTEWVAASDRFLKKFGSPFLFADCRWHYGSALFSTGQWDDAERELLAAMRESRPETDYHIGAAARLSEIYVHRGRYEAAESLAQRLGDHPVSRRIIGVIKHARGEHKIAIAHLQRFVDACGSNVIHATSALDLLVDAAIDSGNLAVADMAARRLAELGRDHKSKVVQGHIAFAVGRVALAKGDHPTARAALDRAVTTFASGKLRLDAARARIALAKALAARADDVEIARLEAKTACSTFQELGASRNTRVAEELLRTLGGTPA